MRALVKLLAKNKGFIAFVFCMVVFRSAVADWNVVPTGSMQPTIRIGDRIVVNKLAYDIRVPLTHLSLVHLGDPQRGDIVVLDSKAADERLVKRVIGLPGDNVALRGNVLYIDGVVAKYSPDSASGIQDDLKGAAVYEAESLGSMTHAVRLQADHPSPVSDFGPVTVPSGEYLLLGDNRDNSADSRYLGFFPRNEIMGRSRYVAYSLDPANHYLPRTNRFVTVLD